MFSTMPLFIETVLPIRTSVAICLIVFFAINIFKDVRARFTFLCSKPWRSQLVIFFATPCLLSVVLKIVRSIAFDIPKHMWLATKYWVTPFLAVLVLWNTWVYICTTNSGNISTNIELSVDNCLGFETILWVLNIDLRIYLFDDTGW